MISLNEGNLLMTSDVNSQPPCLLDLFTGIYIYAPTRDYFCFFKVCDRLYPLTADTPVLLANSGIFMFPDSLVETPGSYVGLVLSSELPATDREMFQDLLSQLVDLRIQVSIEKM